jgi:hypothetical protein
MGYMWWNLTPNLYIVFDLLLTSHFDGIPLKDQVNELIIQSLADLNIRADQPLTENMAIFDIKTSIVYANLIDAMLVLLILIVLFVLMKIIVNAPYSCL